MVTIRDIARKAGVAASTASDILNERTRCYASAETRTKVLQAAQELGYRTNRLAQGLSRGRARTIGLILQNLRHPFFAEAAMGVEDAASEAGYSVILCNTQAAPDRELDQVRVLADSRVGGIVAVALSVDEATCPILTHKPDGVPLVVVNRAISQPETVSILMRNREAAREVTRRFIERGHRRILYLGGLDTPETPLCYLRSSIERREGYRDAMVAAGLEILETSAAWETREQYVAAARSQMAHFLESAAAPTAVVSMNDLAALGAIQACRQLGRRVPDDVSVFGFDDLDIGRCCLPPISSVSQPFYEAGRLAVRRILTWREDPGPLQIHLDCEILPRESSGDVPGGATR